MLLNVYSTLNRVPELTFPHTLNNRRDRTDPELLPHLNGFWGYVMSQGGGEMTVTRYHVLQHIRRVQNHISLNVAEDDLEAFSEWAWNANAICFLPDGTVADPAGQTLITTDGSAPDAEATVPYPEDAWERKQRTDRELAAQGITVPPSVPPVPGADEVTLRSPSDVARRAQGLFFAAVRAESVAGNDPLSVELLREKLPEAREALTPKERQFVENEAPEEQEVVPFSWGYEALHLLQWSLGQSETLAPLTEICDVPQAGRLAQANASQELIATATLRPVEELLDALDKHYRLHWAVRQAQQVENSPAPAGLEGGVIMERHKALNWITCFKDADWDDVTTPT